jgi:hypothetical protein
MFSTENRQQLTDALVAQARLDERIVAAAFVGSSASGGDRWSDLDLTFGVDEDATIADVLSDWTTRMVDDFEAVVLFDLPVQRTIYRVFLLPGALQVDLSFAPASEFGPLGPRFELIFGRAHARQWISAAPPTQTFGLAVHHVVRAHICIERGRLWQAEYWQHQSRDLALTLACHKHGVEPRNGRGFDVLPASIHERFASCFVDTLSAEALIPALAATTTLLLDYAPGTQNETDRLRTMLHEIRNPAQIRDR